MLGMLGVIFSPTSPSFFDLLVGVGGSYRYVPLCLVLKNRLRKLKSKRSETEQGSRSVGSRTQNKSGSKLVDIYIITGRVYLRQFAREAERQANRNTLLTVGHCPNSLLHSLQLY